MGLAIIIQSLPYVFSAIQLSGAAYLAYLGINSLICSFKITEMKLENTDKSLTRKSFVNGFINGFLCNILNPKAFVFFLSVFSQFMVPGISRWVEWIYGFEVVLVIGCWFIILSILVSTPVFKAIYQKCRTWLERFFGVILIYFALKVCKSALN